MKMTARIMGRSYQEAENVTFFVVLRKRDFWNGQVKEY